MNRRSILAGAAAAAFLPKIAVGQSKKHDPRVLRFVPQASLSLLDPVFTTAQPTVNHGWAIYDLLFGVNNKLEVKPQMADGFTVSDDGRTYLITLREGLKFHNGEPVRAQPEALGRAGNHWSDDRTVRRGMGRQGRPHHPPPVETPAAVVDLPAVARGNRAVHHAGTAGPHRSVQAGDGDGRVGAV